MWKNSPSPNREPNGPIWRQIRIVFGGCTSRHWDEHYSQVSFKSTQWFLRRCDDKNQRTSGKTHLTPGPGMYFNAFIQVYSPRAGAHKPLGINVDVNRKPLSLCPFVASFITISLKYDFKHILKDFIHVHSPRARAENPLGTNLWCQQKALITSTIWCKFQTNLFDFLMFFHMYIAPGQGAGADNPLWTKFWCQQKSLVILPICCKLQKISLKSDFIYIFSCFYTCI